MAYTTQAKVTSLFRKLTISASTAVTTDDVTEFISDADAEIDARLKEYYTTPITGAESLKIVGVISKYKVAHVIKQILETSTETSDKTQDTGFDFYKEAERLLMAILPKYDVKTNTYLKPEMPLPDAAVKAVAPESASIMTAPTNTVTFTKGGDNW